MPKEITEMTIKDIIENNLPHLSPIIQPGKLDELTRMKHTSIIDKDMQPIQVADLLSRLGIELEPYESLIIQGFVLYEIHSTKLFLTKLNKKNSIPKPLYSEELDELLISNCVYFAIVEAIGFRAWFIRNLDQTLIEKIIDDRLKVSLSNWLEMVSDTLEVSLSNWLEMASDNNNLTHIYFDLLDILRPINRQEFTKNVLEACATGNIDNVISHLGSHQGNTSEEPSTDQLNILTKKLNVVYHISKDTLTKITLEYIDLIFKAFNEIMDLRVILPEDIKVGLIWAEIARLTVKSILIIDTHKDLSDQLSYIQQLIDVYNEITAYYSKLKGFSKDNIFKDLLESRF